MDETIVQKMIKIQVNYEKSVAFFSHRDNAFALFEYQLKKYFQPLVEQIVPEIKALKNEKNHLIQPYTEFVLDNWKIPFLKELKKDNIVGAQFLNKLSEDLINDFGNLLMSYKKTNVKLKHHFLSQFFKNKSQSILIILKNNTELGIKTISKLNCPPLQFALINRHEEIFRELSDYFLNCSKEEVYTILSKYMSYPQELTVDKYLNEWVGGDYIHIKFCKLILGNYYEDTKVYMKYKNEVK